ncbi:flagellar basal body rod protein FlgC [Paraburkholderia bonniea]|uniref:flagellar basal body rod protein FlgC n=1 Tax=Paraburkholderia bonniea TaxID=2152891 RepID=UPI001292618D|nr:flagellar basal body rod protein FlgC [Paraburkholderia bonniea]WJF90431.1 flagellar basal body rod protein FlgC [Paraburkholderia bonniea]WJF93746.1 flagellar basal body rod protein FlgC [Paraburkholderia bonniea]
MSTLMSIFEVAGSALSAQSQRLNVTASNLANADSTTGPDGKPYKAKQVVFEVKPAGGGYTESGQQIGGVRVSRVIDDPSPMKTSYEPGNPAANAEGYVTQPNVDPVQEMVNMISASRSYQANVETLNTVKQLLIKTLTIGSS